MITVERYTKKEKDNWNTFNRSAKNPLFMFDRDYMVITRIGSKTIRCCFIKKVN